MCARAWCAVAAPLRLLCPRRRSLQCCWSALGVEGKHASREVLPPAPPPRIHMARGFSMESIFILLSICISLEWTIPLSPVSGPAVREVT